MIYQIRDKETGNAIMEEYATEEEAEKKVREYEEEDKKNNEYTPDFYEIVEIEA